MSFQPANELEALIYAGDGNAALDLLERMGEADRVALAERLDVVARLMHYWWCKPEVVHASWGMRASDGQRDAIAVAALVCSPAELAASFHLPAERVVQVAMRFRPASLPTLARELSKHGHPAAALRLAQTGLSPFEMDEEAIMRLMVLPRRQNDIRDYLVMHVEALKPVLLHMFDIEGTGEDNLAAIDKYTFKEERTWAWNLLRLCEDGVYSREELLARCLGTLERDWPQFRAGWFSRLHDRLEPTGEEMARESGRYLALLQSRIPPTVTMALKACTKLFDKRLLDANDLLEALRPVMLSSVKAQLNAALKLLDVLVKRDSDASHAAARLALDGLQHTDPELQQAIVARVAKWGLDEDGRAAAQDMRVFAAPSVQPALAVLLDVTPAQPLDDWREIELPSARRPMSPLDPARALVGPPDRDALVALCAQLLEDDFDLDRLEAALGALLLAAPFDAGAREAFAPVLKRARKLKHQQEYKACVSREFSRLLLAVVAGERVPSVWPAKAVTGVLAARMDELADFAAAGRSMPAPDVATHRGGYIAAEVLVERLAALGPAANGLPLTMQVRALLRLAPGRNDEALRAAQALPPSAFGEALCYALGGDWPVRPQPALCLAAARIRHPGADDPRALLAFGGDMPDGARAAQVGLSKQFVQSEYGDYWTAGSTVVPAPGAYHSSYLAACRYQDFWQASDALIMFGASLFPSSREAMLAIALPQMAEEVQWPEANWHHSAYLRLLADPTAQMTPAASLALGLGLMGKEPGQVAMAVDAFVAASLDGRLAPEDLGRSLLTVVNCFFMAARLARSLEAAASADPAMAAVVVALLGTLCELPGAEPPRDMAKLLQLMQELVLQYRLRPGAQAQAALAKLTLTGKAKAARDAILASAGGPGAGAGRSKLV